MRRSALLANACGLLVGLLVLAACGGGGDLDSDIDRAVDQVQDLEDEVDLLERAITTSTTAPPPPATLATVPPTTADPNAPIRTTTSTTETTVPEDIADASEAAILGVVGEAAWDPSLPVPASCIGNATFTPNGELGANGGILTCTVDAPLAAVDTYYRFGLTRNGFPFSGDTDESSFSLAIGSQAGVSGTASGDRTTLTIEQRYP